MSTTVVAKIGHRMSGCLRSAGLPGRTLPEFRAAALPIPVGQEDSLLHPFDQRLDITLAYHFPEIPFDFIQVIHWSIWINFDPTFCAWRFGGSRRALSTHPKRSRWIAPRGTPPTERARRSRLRRAEPRGGGASPALPIRASVRAKAQRTSRTVWHGRQRP